MVRRDFKKLLNSTNHATVDTFDFVEEVTMISSALGEVVGKTFPTVLTPVAFSDAASCINRIGKKVGLQAKMASRSSRDSTR